jgi:hypothetical protein
MDEWFDWFRDRWAALALAAVAGLTGLWWWQGRPVAQPAGILVPADPVQTEPASREPWSFRHHRITPLAQFELRARVLSTERYRFDRPAELSPVDFSLGWGPMSDSSILQAFSIQQRDRWYFWSASRMPIAEAEVITHSANMHMIPATGAVEKRLLAVRTGQIVELHGQLIRADAKDGWHWVSSLTRSDTGDGSCEVVWVESVRAADHADGM